MGSCFFRKALICRLLVLLTYDCNQGILIREERLKNRLVVCLFLALGLFAGCAYFNTFYNAQVYYREGLRLKERGQAGQAKPKFDKAIEKSAVVISRWPRSRWVDDALFLIGKGYYEKGEFARAVRSFSQLELAFPNSPFLPRAMLYQGVALIKDGNMGAGKLILDKVKQRYPKLRDAASFHLAVIALEHNDDQEAVDSLKVFVQRFPRSKYYREAVKELAEGCLRLGDYSDAEVWFSRYAQLETDARKRAEAKVKIAACRLAENRYEDALKMIGDILGRYQDLDDELNLIAGKAYSAMKRHNEALPAFARVRTNNANGAEAAFMIGKYYEENKDFARARVYYDSAKIRRAESDYGVLAIKRLALLDAIAGDTLHIRSPVEAKFLLAEVHNLNLGEYDTAMAIYQQVYDSFPDSEWAPKALFAKAWILRRIKEDSLAGAEVLRKIVAEYPKTEYAAESRRLLGLMPPGEKKK